MRITRRARELSTFDWPVTSERELARLLSCEHAAPTSLVGCEFTGAVREELTRVSGEVVLSVDLRASGCPGVHAILDLREVAGARCWRSVYVFPPCYHQTLSDTTAREAKLRDGRAFWGCTFMIWCWCIEVTRGVLVEQPDTCIPDFFLQPTQRILPSYVGDADGKPINLYCRGRAPVAVSSFARALARHKRPRDFGNARERDEYRSSWLRFPHLVAAVVAAGQVEVGPARAVSYLEQVELFAAAWYDRGLSVPSDYLNADARPSSLEACDYQKRRGRGDGRSVHGVVPLPARH